MQINSTDILSRLKSAMKLKNDAELSRVINISPGGLSTWKARNSIDHDKIIAVCHEKGLDLNYIFGLDVSTLQTINVDKSSQTAAKDKGGGDLLVTSLLKNIALLEDRLAKSEQTLKRAEEAEQRLLSVQKELINAQAELLENAKKLGAVMQQLEDLQETHRILKETITAPKKKKAA